MVVYPIPNRTALFLTETSVNYLTLSGNPIFYKALKVASYVLTLGILPLIAYKIAGSYYSVRWAEYNKLTSFAAQSLPNALWVSQNIKEFRLNSYFHNCDLADVVMSQIGANYDDFLQQSNNQNNIRRWFEDFDLDGWKRSSIFRNLAGKVDQYAGLGTENLKHGRVFERIGDFDIDQEERESLFISLAYQGIVPRKDLVTPEERLSIIKTLITGSKFEYGRALIFKTIREYELNPEQRFDMCLALAQNKCLNTDIRGFLTEFPELNDKQIYAIATACVKCEMIHRSDSNRYFIDQILQTLNAFRITPAEIPTLLQQCELSLDESEAKKVLDFIQVRMK